MEPKRLVDPFCRISWQEYSTTDRMENLKNLSSARIEEALFANKLHMFIESENIMQSIYVRALKESASYFEQYRQFLGTEYSTRLRPKIRYRIDRPVELAWVSKVVLKTFATRDDLRKYGRKGVAKDGILTRISFENNQAYKIREIFKYLPRGKSHSYPLSIFRREPGWVQVEGKRLEGIFSILRQEMSLLKEIRLKAASLHALDKKLFDDDPTFFPTDLRVGLDDPKEYFHKRMLDPEMTKLVEAAVVSDDVLGGNEADSDAMLLMCN